MITEGVIPNRGPRSAAGGGDPASWLQRWQAADYDLGCGKPGAHMAVCLWCRYSPIHCCFVCAGDWDGYLRRDVVAVEKPVTERDEEFDELSDQKVADDEITFP